MELPPFLASRKEAATAELVSPLLRKSALLCATPQSAERDKQLRHAANDVYAWLHTEAVILSSLGLIDPPEDVAVGLMNAPDAFLYATTFSYVSIQGFMQQLSAGLRDHELERALAILACVVVCSPAIAVSHHASTRTALSFSLSVLSAVPRFYTARIGHASEQVLGVLDPVLNSTLVWLHLGKLLRSSNNFLVSQVAQIIQSLCVETYFAHSIHAWNLLIDPLARTLKTVSQKQLEAETKNPDNAHLIVAAHPDLVYGDFVNCIFGAIYNGLRSLSGCDDQAKISAVASRKWIRQYLIQYGTTLDFSGGPMRPHAHSRAAMALEICFQPPQDRDDERKMALWRRRIRLFDTRDILFKMHALLKNLLTSDKLWQEHAKSLALMRQMNTRGYEHLLTSLEVLQMIPPTYYSIIDSMALDEKNRKIFMTNIPGTNVPLMLDLNNSWTSFFYRLKGTMVHGGSPRWLQLQDECLNVGITHTVFERGTGRQFYVRDVPPAASSSARALLRVAPIPQNLQIAEFVATNVKDAANDDFKDKDYLKAIFTYSFALEAIEGFPSLKSLRVILLSNRAQAHLQLKMAKEALADCDAALKIDPTHFKSVERRKVALAMLERKEEPLQEYTTVHGTRRPVKRLESWAGPSIASVLQVPARLLIEAVAEPAPAAPPPEPVRLEPKILEEPPVDAAVEQDSDEGWYICGSCHSKNNCNHALIPCGHVVCEPCAKKLKTCEFCRADVKSVLKIYMN